MIKGDLQNWSKIYFYRVVHIHLLIKPKKWIIFFNELYINFIYKKNNGNNLLQLSKFPRTIELEQIKKF